MGIIVLALAVLPRLRVGGRQLMESEAPGPELEALTASIRDTARRLWLLYVVLTALLVLILASFGWTGVDERMSLFNAVAYAFSAMPTGGFGIDPRSLEGYAPASQWVLALFMAIAGANFALLYRAFVRRKPVALARDEEFRLYLGLLVLASGRHRRDPLGRGHQLGRGGDPAGGLPDGLDHDDDRLRQHRLQHLDRGGAGRGDAASSRSCSRAARQAPRRARSRSSGTSSSAGCCAGSSTRPCTPSTSRPCASTASRSTSARSAR